MFASMSRQSILYNYLHLRGDYAMVAQESNRG